MNHLLTIMFLNKLEALSNGLNRMNDGVVAFLAVIIIVGIGSILLRCILRSGSDGKNP